MRVFVALARVTRASSSLGDLHERNSLGPLLQGGPNPRMDLPRPPYRPVRAAHVVSRPVPSPAQQRAFWSRTFPCKKMLVPGSRRPGACLPKAPARARAGVSSGGGKGVSSGGASCPRGKGTDDRWIVELHGLFRVGELGCGTPNALVVMFRLVMRRFIDGRPPPTMVLAVQLFCILCYAGAWLTHQKLNRGI